MVVRGAQPAIVTIREARAALGQRLRDIRKDAGLTGRALAQRAGWHESKVSKIEYGKQTPSEGDIHRWCELCRVPEQVTDLLAALGNVAAANLEHRRNNATGQPQTKPATQLTRWYEPCLIPGPLQTRDYVAAVLCKVTTFYEGPAAGFAAALEKRVEQQRILHNVNRRFHFILAEQVLHTTVGGNDVMAAQLDRLLVASPLPRITVGIIPTDAPYEVPTTNFVMYDRRYVQVETIAAELTITQPREIDLYERTFETLSGQAVYGAGARAIIEQRLNQLR